RTAYGEDKGADQIEYDKNPLHRPASAVVAARTPHKGSLPAVTHRIDDSRLAVRRNFQRKVDGLCVALFILVTVCRDLPAAPPVQVLAHDDARGFLLSVAHADLERLVDDLAGGVDVEGGLAALADDIEGVAQLDAHVLVARRVLDHVFADEFERTVGGGLVHAHAAGRQWCAQLVGFGVAEFQPRANRAFGGRPVALVAYRLRPVTPWLRRGREHQLLAALMSTAV